MSIRAWVRRGVASEANFLKLTEHCEAVEIAAWVSEHIGLWDPEHERQAPSEDLWGNVIMTVVPRKRQTFPATRLMTATILDTSCSDDTNNDLQNSMFSPTIPPAKFHEMGSGFKNRRTYNLVGDLQRCINPCSEDGAVAVQLVNAVCELLRHTWSNPSISWHERDDLDIIVWHLHLVDIVPDKTTSWTRRNSVAPTKSVKLIPRKHRMDACRIVSERGTKRWDLVTDCDWGFSTAEYFRVLIEMDRWACMSLIPGR